MLPCLALPLHYRHSTILKPQNGYFSFSSGSETDMWSTSHICCNTVTITISFSQTISQLPVSSCAWKPQKQPGYFSSDAPLLLHIDFSTIYPLHSRPSSSSNRQSNWSPLEPQSISTTQLTNVTYLPSIPLIPSRVVHINHWSTAYSLRLLDSASTAHLDKGHLESRWDYLVIKQRKRYLVKVRQVLVQPNEKIASTSFLMKVE